MLFFSETASKRRDFNKPRIGAVPVDQRQEPPAVQVDSEVDHWAAVQPAEFDVHDLVDWLNHVFLLQQNIFKNCFVFYSISDFITI